MPDPITDPMFPRAMEEIEILCRIHPVAATALTMMRDRNTSPPEFAKQLDRLSMFLATEATCTLDTRTVELHTPMGPCLGKTLYGIQALVPVMRAGAGMLDAFRRLLPDAVVWHVSVARDEHTFEPMFKDSKIPENVKGIDTVYVLDPMLATGGSACFTIDLLKKKGLTKIVYVGVIGCPTGVRRLRALHPDVRIILGDVDPTLNEKAYIVPGLGDAGDRLFPTVPWLKD